MFIKSDHNTVHVHVGCVGTHMYTCNLVPIIVIGSEKKGNFAKFPNFHF